MRRNRLALLALVLALSLSLTACGEKKDVIASPPGPRQPFTLMLDWVPNADHVGIYEGLAQGQFARAGIDLHVQAPTDPATPLALLAAGKVDAAISYEPEVLLARNRGLPLVSVAAIVQRPLTSIISLGSQRITSVKALKGKRVGDAGLAYQHAYLNTLLTHAGVSSSQVSEVNVGGDLVPAMLTKRVNATLGGYWNYEALQLQQEGKHPNVLRVDQIGVPSYDELVLVVKRGTIANRTDLLRRFVQAVTRGYQATRADPQAAVNALLAANPGLDPKLQLASVRATLSSFFPTGNHPWGWQDATRWNAYGQWMINQHLISVPNAVVDASTDELLAGQGP
ncbi:MAG: ABC transporter substrate-binding protein [Candidatus Dormibacteraeota bacterium]|nr:ABC transporter substrate-binding protein [Candidatus Dormibacteraeota bacterium]